MLDVDIIKELERRMTREGEIIGTLDPSLPMLTRIVMAGDLRQQEDQLAALRSGDVDINRALALTGSYGRMALLLAAIDGGIITRDEATSLLPDWWPSSDPDDTDRRLIDLWQWAFRRNNGLVTDEGYALPPGAYLNIWRGQRQGDPLGCAWSLSKHTAEKFAKGASFRTAVSNPELIEATMPRGLVLAYLTGRGEEEVIVDPDGLSRVANRRRK